MRIKFSRWRSCHRTPPKENGTYLVVKFSESGELIFATHLKFDVVFGWQDYWTHIEYEFEHVGHDEGFLWSTVKKVNK